MTAASQWSRRLRTVLEVLTACGILVLGFTLCRRAIILSDEGYLLLQALDLAHGKVLYRDMDAFVAPGAWFLLAGLFRLVDPSVLVTRVVACACYLATVWTCHRIVLRVAGRSAALGATVALGVFTVWAFPSWTVSFYSPYAVFFALAALDRVLVWQEARRTRDFALIGVCLGLAILFKQNYGALAALGCGVAIAGTLLESSPSLASALGATLRGGLWISLGATVAMTPAVAYFVYHGAVDDAVNALLIRPFQSFVGAHTIAYLDLDELWRPHMLTGTGRFTYETYATTKTAIHLRWPEILARSVDKLHVVMYWLPPALCATATVLVVRSAWRRTLDTSLLAVLAVAGLVFLGVFPRADFNHLANVYQPMIVLAAILTQRAYDGRWPGKGLVLTAAGAALAPYALVSLVWYHSLLTIMNTELSMPRGGVLVHAWEAGMIDFEVAEIQKRTAPGEPVLTLPGLAMLNFLAERPMPTPYYNLYAVHIAHDQGASVVEKAEAARVRLAVAESNNFFSDPIGMREYAPLLTDYLRRRFDPLFAIAVDKHLFLERRDTPQPQRSSLSAVANCDAARGATIGRRVVREHLFFETLHHFFGNNGSAERNVLDTTCITDIPEGAVLTTRLGYRQPDSIDEEVHLIAELWSPSPDEGSTLVFRTELTLAPVSSWATPPPTEYQIDLSDLAGEAVPLVFRTILEGTVQMNPLDIWGFAMSWQDPEINFDAPDS